MPADHEPPKRRSGEPTDGGPSLTGDRADAVSRLLAERLRELDGRVSDQAAADADQIAGDSGQTLSDSDQTISDEDQESSEKNQVQSDSDQRAADRDQVASDRDHDLHGRGDAKFEKAYEASQGERAHSTAERKATADLRAVSMNDRFKNASRRDQDAALRDTNASVRDRTADLRDQATEAHERALGRENRHAAKTRETARADRDRAAEDRARAAADRKKAADDRDEARMALEAAQLDELTGFYRLGLGKALLEREIDRSRREDGHLVLAFCDIDNLKRVNDEIGHAAGDTVIQEFARAMRSRLRSYDPVVRVGGDEFVCALSHTEIDQAKRTLGDVQSAFDTVGRGKFSMTFGLAALQPDDSLATLMERSDAALRTAKLAA